MRNYIPFILLILSVFLTRSLTAREVNNAQKMVNKVFNTYILTQKLVYEFDYILGVNNENKIFDRTILAKLEKEKLRKNIFETDTYKKIMILKHLIDQVEDGYVDAYFGAIKKMAAIQRNIIDAQRIKKTSEIAKHKASYRKAKEILNSIKTLVHTINFKAKGYDPILNEALLGTVHALADQIDERLSNLKNIYKIKRYLGIRMFINKEIVLTKITKARIQKFDMPLVKLLTFTRYNKTYIAIKNSINFKELVKEVNQNLKEAKQEYRTRIPSNFIIYSSIGKNGNITGYKYPDNLWSITYDDGPNTGTSLDILDHYINHEMKATWFVLGRLALKNTTSAMKIIEAGMEIAAHSMTHKNIPKHNKETQRYEIVEATDKLDEEFGTNIKFIRLPYGSGLHNNYIRKLIADRGLIHTFWNVDSLDWKDKNPESIFKRVKAQMKKQGGGVILFHDIHRQSERTTKMLLEYMTEESQTVCTLGAAVKQINGEVLSCLDVDLKDIDRTPRAVDKIIINDVSNICDLLKARVKAISKIPFDNSESTNTCFSSSQWDRFSTPHRDQKIIDAIIGLENRYNMINKSDYMFIEDINLKTNLRNIFSPNNNENEYPLCKVEYTTEQYVTLQELISTLNIDKKAKTPGLNFSYNPHDNIHLRWGKGKASNRSNCTKENNPQKNYYGYKI